MPGLVRPHVVVVLAHLAASAVLRRRVEGGTAIVAQGRSFAAVRAAAGAVPCARTYSADEAAAGSAGRGSSVSGTCPERTPRTSASRLSRRSQRSRTPWAVPRKGDGEHVAIGSPSAAAEQCWWCSPGCSAASRGCERRSSRREHGVHADVDVARYFHLLTSWLKDDALRNMCEKTATRDVDQPEMSWLKDDAPGTCSRTS